MRIYTTYTHKHDIHIYVYIHTCMNIHLHTIIHICMNAHKSTETYRQIDLNVDIYTHIKYRFIYTHIHTDICTKIQYCDKY